MTNLDRDFTTFNPFRSTVTRSNNTVRFDKEYKFLNSNTRLKTFEQHVPGVEQPLDESAPHHSD